MKNVWRGNKVRISKERQVYTLRRLPMVPSRVYYGKEEWDIKTKTCL